MINILTASCLLLTLSLTFGVPLTCPAPEDVYPCSCIIVSSRLHVTCAKFNDSTKLVRAFKNLRGYSIHNLLLYGLYLKDILPNDLFGGFYVTELQVQQCSLKFSQPAFSGLDDCLYVLNVAQNSMIKSDDDFSLSRLRKLTELRIKSVSLKKVKDSWFDGTMPSVHSMVLEEDEITEIENNAFASLSQLKTISLADNSIKIVERSMFPTSAQMLFKIDLSMNILESLPDDMFSNMPSLEEVVLTGNDLKTLPRKTWEPVWQQLRQVFLIENKLECNEDLKWIKKYPPPHQLKGKCVSPSHMNGKSINAMYKP